jgi:hypothetical protein
MSDNAMQDLYIYYRVAEANSAALASKVGAMQQQLGATFGVVGQLKRRPQASGDVQTWMEVYLGTRVGFEQALADAVRDAGLAALIDGERHIEIFTDVLSGETPCA